MKPIAYRPVIAIVVGGGVAATFDIVYAVLRNGGRGRSPLWTLQSVASGWLGNAAFDSGMPGGLLGLASHYSILFIAALIYYLMSKQLPFLRTRWMLCGALFGVLVYLFMNFAVLPLSAFPFKLDYTIARLSEGFLSHAVLVGLPIAWAVRHTVETHSE